MPVTFYPTETLPVSDTGSSAPPREQGFWTSLFGSGPEHDTSVDTSVYDRSIESGSSIFTVRVPDEGVDRVTSIMESHNPIDLDGRATQYAAENTAGARPALQPRTTRSGWPRKTLQSASGEVSGGTTRVRCYVVETPVEERVTLQGEKVIVDCCPVTGGQPVAEFTDKTIEMTETNEKPVVSKTARVTDEVSLHKEATDRVETVGIPCAAMRSKSSRCLGMAGAPRYLLVPSQHMRSDRQPTEAGCMHPASARGESLVNEHI